jgi:cytochrome P450
MDGEEHRRWRSLMSRTFTPRSVERLRPAFAEESRRLVAQFAGAGECEFVAQFARQLPSFGLAELIGVPTEDRGRFSAWADTVGLGMNLALSASRIVEIDGALRALIDYTGGLLRERRQQPRDDLVTRLAQAVDVEGGFSEDHLAASLAGLVFAGYETTKNQLSFMIASLAGFPEEWERVAKEPARAPKTVEELLRHKSTISFVGRISTEDLVVAGCPFPKGTRLLASLWGGNRDPSIWRTPERVDPDAHAENPQLAFGHGAHYCVGAALARAELQEALVALSSALTCPRLCEGAEWLPPIGITGPTRLPIAFTVR